MATFFKTFVLVLSLISYSCQAVTEDDVKAAHDDCKKETNVSEDVISKAENGEFADNKEFKCFTKCFYAKLGYVNDAGDPQLNVIKENIPETDREKGYKALESCKEPQGSDPCEKVFQLHKCYYEKMGQELDTV